MKRQAGVAGGREEGSAAARPAAGLSLLAPAARPVPSPHLQRVSAHFVNSVQGRARRVPGCRESHLLSPPGACTEAP